jgi:hypothetical protein
VLLQLSGRHPLLSHGPQLAADGEERLTVDLTELRFASPLELAAVGVLVSHHRIQGAPTTVRLPRAPDVASYLQRMDLFRHAGQQTRVLGVMPADDRRDQSNVLLELRRVHEPADAEAVTAGFADLAQARFGGATWPFHALGELLDNATSHGKSEIGAFAAAQYYRGTTSGRPGLELAVCDAGVGVLEHLRRNPRNQLLPTSRSALRRALRAGVSGTSERRGYGLHDVLKRIGRVHMASLVLASGEYAIHRRLTPAGSVTRAMRLVSPIRGTWAWVRVRLPPGGGQCFNEPGEDRDGPPTSLPRS